MNTGQSQGLGKGGKFEYKGGDRKKNLAGQIDTNGTERKERGDYQVDKDWENKADKNTRIVI